MASHRFRTYGFRPATTCEPQGASAPAAPPAGSQEAAARAPTVDASAPASAQPELNALLRDYAAAFRSQDVDALWKLIVPPKEVKTRFERTASGWRVAE